MENNIKRLEQLSMLNTHVSKEWVLKHIMGIDPVLFERRMKINKILNGNKYINKMQ